MIMPCDQINAPVGKLVEATAKMFGIQRNIVEAHPAFRFRKIESLAIAIVTKQPGDPESVGGEQVNFALVIRDREKFADIGQRPTANDV